MLELMCIDDNFCRHRGVLDTEKGGRADRSIYIIVPFGSVLRSCSRQPTVARSKSSGDDMPGVIIPWFLLRKLPQDPMASLARRTDIASLQALGLEFVAAKPFKCLELTIAVNRVASLKTTS